MHGRFAGTYYKTGGGIIHCQRLPRHVRMAPTVFQGRMIGAMSGAAAFWLMLLLGSWAAIWVAFALEHLFSKPGHRPHRITGYMWYIHYALMFPETEKLPMWKPPHKPYELPDFVITYRGTWMYENTTGDGPFVSCADYYWEDGLYNHRVSYRTDNREWYLFWNGTNWVISIAKGLEPHAWTFYSTGVFIEAYYQNPVTHRWAHVYAGKP